jgi:hypothetical protein
VGTVKQPSQALKNSRSRWKMKSSTIEAASGESARADSERRKCWISSSVFEAEPNGVFRF